MKTEKFLAFALVAVLALVAGCATSSRLDNLAFTPTDFRTNVTPPRVTQLVETQIVIVTLTNASGAVSHATNREPVTVNVTVPAQTNIVPVAWQPNAATVAAVQGAAGFVPGYGGLIGTGFAVLMAGLAQWRSKKFRDAALSVIRGAGEIVEALPTESKVEAVEALKKAQDANGSRATVEKLLKVA